MQKLDKWFSKELPRNVITTVVTSLLVIADDNDKPECISFLTFKNCIIKKMLTYGSKMNLSSNYMLLTRKSIGVNGNVYIRP